MAGFQQLVRVKAIESSGVFGAGDGNRTHVRSLGSLLQANKNARIGCNLAFYEVSKWIPIGAAEGKIEPSMMP
jgi:hypothetical protein